MASVDVCEREKPKTAEEAGLVSLADLIPDMIPDIRYCTSFNFVGTPIDFYEAPVAEAGGAGEPTKSHAKGVLG